MYFNRAKKKAVGGVLFSEEGWERKQKFIENGIQRDVSYLLGKRVSTDFKDKKARFVMRKNWPGNVKCKVHLERRVQVGNKVGNRRVQPENIEFPTEGRNLQSRRYDLH